MNRILFGLLASAFSLTLQATHAETLSIPKQATEHKNNVSVQHPARGALKAHVQQDLGQPLRKSAAVGKPAISRWSYTQFTVFFEEDRVLHTINTSHKD